VISASQLVEKVHEKIEAQGSYNIPKKHVQAVMHQLTDVIISEVLSNKKEIRWKGFGTFKVKTIPAALRRNPATGENFQSVEKTKLMFKPSNTMASGNNTKDE
jgi:nucleoid DNA-binding protein